MSDFKNGDAVTYRECFGEKLLIFIGCCDGLAFSNNAVVLHNEDCVPVRLEGLELFDGDLCINSHCQRI